MADTVNSILKELLDSLPDGSALRRRADIRLDEAAKKRLDGMPFESLWERVARVTGDAFVSRTLDTLCGTGAANFHHRAIAWLVARGHVRTVFTTNYDEFIESAIFSGTGMTQEYQSFAECDSMVVTLAPCASGPGASFRLVKLHGTLSQPATLAFKFPQITSGFRTETETAIRAELTSAPTLFVGYGCNDWDLRRVLKAPLEAVWVTHLGSWESIDLRCRSLCEFHRSTRWYRSNLRSGAPTDSVLVQLARQLGCNLSWDVVLDTNAPRSFLILDAVDRGQRLAILAELLDSLALRVAADVFRRAASAAPTVQEGARHKLSVHAALSHDMDIRPRRQFRYGEALLRRTECGNVDRVAVLSQLAFTYLITGHVCNGAMATLRVLVGIWRLAGSAKSQRLFDKKPADWGPNDRHLAVTLAKAREVFAHNLLRAAWFHFPGPKGRAIRVIRALGVRRLFAEIARRTLLANETVVAHIGELFSVGNLRRESAHALCLSGHPDHAISSAEEAEDALAWGRWYQWQANAIRTRGWVWLHIGGGIRRIRRYADREAKRSFARAVALCNEFVGPRGEMLDDRIKALLELKRLALLEGTCFELEDELAKDLAAIAASKPTNHSRYLAIATNPPRSREPLG